MKQAVIYARFSSEKQAKGYSIERQVELAKAHIERQGWQHVDTILDEAKSAFHGANRVEGSAFYQFEVEARAGHHRDKVLVVENIDRLSRQAPKIAAQLIWSLNEHGVDVATFHDSVNYRAGSGDMMEVFSLIIRAGTAHAASEEKSKRTNARWQKRFEEIRSGRRDVKVGRTPSWLKFEEGKGYVVIEQRAALIREIFDLYLQGIGISRIVQILNARGESTWESPQKKRKADGWYLPTVHKLLNSPSLHGEYRTLKDEFIASDFFPAVIDYPTFAQVQALLRARNKTGGKTFNTQNNILATLVRCNVCGRKMGYENKGKPQPYRKRDGTLSLHKRKPFERLRCDANRRKVGCTNGRLFDYPTVERAVLDRVLDFAVAGMTKNPAIEVVAGQIQTLSNDVQNHSDTIDRLVDTLAAMGGSAAITDRLKREEASLALVQSELEAARGRYEVEQLKPTADADQALVKRLRLDISSDDQEIRNSARKQVNDALRRICSPIYFDESGVWAFEMKGVGGFRFDIGGSVIEPFRFDTQQAELRESSELEALRQRDEQHNKRSRDAIQRRDLGA